MSLTPRTAPLRLPAASTLFLLTLSTFSSPRSLLAAAPKVHTVTLGAFRKVPYTQPDATPETKTDETTSLKIRPLFVDDHQKEWTTGDVHDITDRTFTVRRALRLNDALPTDAAPHWIWQPGPWLSVDRVTGHITALHLPDFDAAVSDVVWFRDYAAYCGIATTAKGGLSPSSRSSAHGSRSCRSRSAPGLSRITSFPSASPRNGNACPRASP